MMWFDDDKGRTLKEKIENAAAFYTEKYGAAPNICFTNDQALEDDLNVDRIDVKPHKFVRPQHFWIGLAA